MSLIRSSPSYLLLLHRWGGCGSVQGLEGGAGCRPSLVFQGDDKDLDRLLHQLLPVVGEQQVVVRDAVPHRVIGTHHVEQRCEQRQGMSGREAVKDGSRSVATVYLLYICTEWSHMVGYQSFPCVQRSASEGLYRGAFYVPQCRLTYSRGRCTCRGVIVTEDFSQSCFCPPLFLLFQLDFLIKISLNIVLSPTTKIWKKKKMLIHSVIDVCSNK